MEERVRRKGKSIWRFVRLEKTPFPKIESPFHIKLLKMEMKKNNNNHQKGTKQK